MATGSDGQLIGQIVEKWPLGSGACAYVVEVRCAVSVGDRVRIVKADGSAILDAISGLEDAGKMLDAVTSGRPGLLLSNDDAEAGDVVYKVPTAVEGAEDSATAFLSPAVVAEVTRLGGKFALPAAGAGASAARPRRIARHELPEAMAAYVRDIRWPHQTYTSEDMDGDVDVWMVEFGTVGPVEPNEIRIGDRGDRDLIYFALTDGGNYFLVMDVADPDPTDPRVYVIDHDDAGQTLGSGTKLSDFLRQLRPEAEG